MELLHEDEIPASSVLRTFGASPWPSIVFLSLVAGAIVAGGRWLLHGPDVPLVMWVILAPFALVMALVMLLLLSALPHAVVAGFKSSNWYLKVASDGLYVKFRTYLNYHFPNDGPTVAFLPYNEMASVGCQLWEMDMQLSSQRKSRKERYLVVSLKAGSLESLRLAVREERNRKAPKIGFSSIKFNDMPVRVQQDDKVLIRWPLLSFGWLTQHRNAALLASLSEYVTVKEEVEVVSSRGGDRASTQQNDDLILEFVERGEITSAVALAREEYGLGTTDAKQFVESISAQS